MPQDRQTYSELDRSSWTYMPTLVRWRHRYRGTRESLKVNQEINQILHDLYDIKGTLDATLEMLETVQTEEYRGKYDYEDVSYYDSIEGEIASQAHAGIDDLVERLSGFEKVIREMENNV